MRTRRNILAGMMAGAAGWAALHGRRARAAESFKVTHSEAEWRQMLTPGQFAVLREAATERPFTSKLLDEHRRGRFACAGCGLENFSSETKFESGTGWPSFWAALDGAVGETADHSFGMERTAIHCAQCGGHLGHLFDDGPQPTGLRYCMNGIALTFKPASA